MAVFLQHDSDYISLSFVDQLGQDILQAGPGRLWDHGQLDVEPIADKIRKLASEDVRFPDAVAVFSTIGIVITTDGSITDLPREAYIEAETEVIDELNQIGKPFIIIVNSADPQGSACQMVVDKLKERHDVPIIAMAVNSMSQRDVYHILREALYEFPVSTININMPGWVSVLDDDHWLK